MQVYHGSYTVIDEIDLSKAHLNRDFGQGFYVTKYRKHAENWAKTIGEKYGNEGFVTEFTYYDSAFTENLCNVKHFDAYNEEWLDFVVLNRNPMAPKPVHNFDIVEGPVADDKVQRTLAKYLEGEISKKIFLKMLSYHEPTHQICFCTMRSLLVLNKKHDNNIFCIEDIAEQIVEQLTSTQQINETQAADIFYASATFTRLADKNTELYRQPWQKIYALLKAELETSEKKS
ncbi:MAG: DUF3990 domain-containing protein [Prevotellaceae bacterium]|jgi:hypothetical protein|nr:DUF3990 domain-containing protein [Prevotellaceae bacterium]